MDYLLSFVLCMRSEKGVVEVLVEAEALSGAKRTSQEDIP